MSLKYIRVARTARGITPTARLVLWTLADMARDDGRAWPSQQHLADATGLSARTIRTALGELERVGWLWREQRRRRDGSRASDLIHLRTLETAVRHARDQLRLPLMAVVQAANDRQEQAANAAGHETPTSKALKHPLRPEPPTPPPEPARSAPGYPGGDQGQQVRHTLRRPTRSNVEAILLKGIPRGRRPATIRTQPHPVPPLAQVVWPGGLAAEEAGAAADRADLQVLPRAG